MPEVRFARSTRRPSEIVGDDPDTLKKFCNANGIAPNALVAAGRAYSLDIGDSKTRCIVRRINSLPLSDRKNAANAAASMGDGVHTLSAFFQEHLSFLDVKFINSAVNAGSGAAYQRLTGFQKAVADYQRLLMELQEFHGSYAGPGRGAYLDKIRRQIREAYHKLETRYRAELNRFAPEAFRAKNRGGALSNADRGITLAERSAAPAKSDPRLNVADTVQASRMGLLAKGFNYLGNSAVAVDGAFRVGKVKTTYDAGGNWLKESSRQMTGFGFGGASGIYAGKVTVAAGTVLATSMGLMSATPVGWVVLGVIVVAGALVGMGVGYYMDQFGKFISETLWEAG